MTFIANHLVRHTYYKIIERRFIIMSGYYGGNGGGYGNGTGFALLVVLFILLIIVGAAFLYNSY
jgi:uncharacterized protein (TIGR01732 family)